ncbi:MAG TPA: BON domain-containing protein [Gemmataceae bacterium]|nr:BON domain-containing protein [Gemmataceae bacterium]
MRSFYRGVKSAWLYGLSGLAALALAIPAVAQVGLSSGSTGSGGGGSGSFGLSGGTGGAGGSGSFGLSGGGGSSSTLGMGSTSGTAFGTGTSTSPFGASSAFGSGTTTGTGGPGGTGQFGTGARGGTNQPFFPTAATSNPFGKYYMNPLTPGTLNVSRTATFGQPIYATVTTTNASGGARGGAGAGSSSSAGGYMTNTQAPRYGISMEALPVAPGPRPATFGVSSRARQEVQGVLTRSSALSGNGNITVAVDNGMLVLRGNVSSEHERQLAEGLALMTPGVNTLRNELRVSP